MGQEAQGGAGDTRWGRSHKVGQETPRRTTEEPFLGKRAKDGSCPQTLNPARKPQTNHKTQTLTPTLHAQEPFFGKRRAVGGGEAAGPVRPGPRSDPADYPSSPGGNLAPGPGPGPRRPAGLRRKTVLTVRRIRSHPEGGPGHTGGAAPAADSDSATGAGAAGSSP